MSKEMEQNINNLPSAQQWIPVKKCTPGIKMDHPHTDNYLVTYDSGDVGVAGWTNNNQFWSTAITSPYWKTPPHCEVIAWMPLPEAYKGGGCGMSRYVDIDKPVIVNVYDDATGQLAKMTVTIAELLAGTIEVLEEDIVRCKDCELCDLIIPMENTPDRYICDGKAHTASFFCGAGRRRIEG